MSNFCGFWQAESKVEILDVNKQFETDTKVVGSNCVISILLLLLSNVRNSVCYIFTYHWWNEPGVNFINILRAAFTHTDPKSAKKTVKLSVFFMLFGSVHSKAASGTLMILTPAAFISFSCLTDKVQWGFEPRTSQIVKNLAVTICDSIIIVNLMKVQTLCILCNNWCLFCLRSLTPDLSFALFIHSVGWARPDKIDRFVHNDIMRQKDRVIESIFILIRTS